ncbi:MAG: hypothetical protein PVG26_11825 [Desulfobacterales bacterium]
MGKPRHRPPSCKLRKRVIPRWTAARTSLPFLYPATTVTGWRVGVNERCVIDVECLAVFGGDAAGGTIPIHPPSSVITELREIAGGRNRCACAAVTVILERLRVQFCPATSVD